MRNRYAFRVALLVSIGLSVAIAKSSSAQKPTLNVKLGLWEATTVVQTSGNFPFDTSQLTPEQRQRIEAAMAKSKAAGAKPHTFKTCITREKLERNPFEDKANRSCKQTVVSSSSTTYDVKFQCSSEDGVQSGEWRFDAATPELVKGTGQMTMERAGNKEGAGNKMTANTSMTAKWIGASCGDVK